VDIILKLPLFLEHHSFTCNQQTTPSANLSTIATIMATNDKVIVKVQKGEEIRRFQLDEQIAWKDFQALVVSLFPADTKVLPPNTVAVPRNFVVKYKDAEGDVISVTSDVELQEAIRLAKLATSQESQEKTNKDSVERILKFFIVSPDEPDLSSGENPCGWSRYRRGEKKCCRFIPKLLIFGLLIGVFLFSKCHLLCFGVLAAVIGVCCFKKYRRFHCGLNAADNKEKCCIFTCVKKLFGCNKKGKICRRLARCAQEVCKTSDDNNNNNNSTCSESTSTNVSDADAPQVGVEDIVEKLKQLEEMGFHDSKKNLSVLSAHNFNVVLTVKDLLDKHN